MAKQRLGNCRICGDYGVLSKEHIPPSKAFNDGEYKAHSINKYKTKKVVVWQQQTKQGGHFAYVMCEKCNNRTGQWYGGEYVKYVRECEPYARPMNAGVIGSIQFSNIYPMRLFKQVLTIICATCDPNPNSDISIVTAPSKHAPIFEPNTSIAHNIMPTLRSLVLDKSACGLPTPLRLYTYLVANPMGRLSSICARGSTISGETEVFVEFSWWPVGWVLVFDGQIKENLTDVTSWAEFRYEEEVSMTVNLPCVWVDSSI